MHNKRFLKKNTDVFIYISTHTKLTYFDHPNKNVEHPNLRIKSEFMF